MDTSRLTQSGLWRGFGFVALASVITVALVLDQRAGPAADGPDDVPGPAVTQAQPVAVAGVVFARQETALPGVAGQVLPGGKDLRRLLARIGDISAGATVATEFRVSSFNVLGHGHTVPGGNRPGWAPSHARMGTQVGLLRARDVDVVGFQEFQPAQYHTFRRLVGSSWDVYPGVRLTAAATHNSIAWRTDTWRLLQASSIPIPYFGGNRIQMPVVLLRHVETRQPVYFANFHNPADAHGNAERWRDLAASLQVGLINRLRRATGFPVVITGDMNERAEYFCRITAAAPMQAANGGTNGGGGCRPPAAMTVDWILGSTDLVFTSYVADRSLAVRRTTDHPMLIADAVLPALTGP